jgi:hypothetical protein
MIEKFAMLHLSIVSDDSFTVSTQLGRGGEVMRKITLVLSYLYLTAILTVKYIL